MKMWLLVVRAILAWERALRGVRAAVPGQGLVEYGLILVLVMVVCVGIIGTTGQTISQIWYDKLLPIFP